MKDLLSNEYYCYKIHTLSIYLFIFIFIYSLSMTIQLKTLFTDYLVIENC